MRTIPNTLLAVLTGCLLTLPAGRAVAHEGLLHPELVDRSQPASTRAARSSGLELLASWGRLGTADGEFNHPVGIATDPSGRVVYVADTVNNRVQKFSSDGAFQAKWDSEGAGDGQFRGPVGVAVDGAGDVYIGEWVNNRMQKLRADGAFITKWGTSGTGAGQFLQPDLLSVDRAGLYVGQLGTSRLQRFTLDGALAAEWGGLGAEDGRFVSGPHGVAVDRAGNVYTADSNTSRVQVFGPDGRFLRAWGSTGTGKGEFRGLHALAVDSRGDVLVTEVLNNRIQKFTPYGRFLASYGRNGGDGSAGSGPGEFNFPEGITVDRHGNIYVTDSGNNRIQKLRESGAGATHGAGAAPGSSSTALPRRSARQRIQLSVRPRVVRAGKQTRFHFRATILGTARARPVSGVLIRFAGTAGRTDRRGRATIVTTILRPGRVRVTAARRGLRSAVATVRVVR